MNLFRLIFAMPLVACGLADPASTTSLPGTYASTSSWDLGGPFNANQTMSENLADIFIANVVSTLGAPNSVEVELSEAISNSIGSDVAVMLEEYIPEDLNENSTILDLLSQNLATINVESDLILSHEKDDLVGLDRIYGSETITRLSLDSSVGALDIPIAELSSSSSEPVISSTYTTTVFQDSMNIEDQSVAIQYGKLVEWVFKEETGVDPSELTNEINDGISCSPFVEQLTSTVGIPEVTVAGQTYTMDLQILADSCAQLESGLNTNTLGIFEPTANLLISGPTAMMYNSNEDRVEQIQSKEGYGGSIEGLPSALSSMLTLSFAAERISD